MFVNRSDERAWSELSTREIVVKTLVYWAIVSVFVAATISRGFQMFDIVVTGFVVLGGISVGANAIGEVNRRQNIQEVATGSNDNQV